MNQGIWRALEDAIRESASVDTDTCVETGPIFTRAQPKRLAGPNRLPIPDAYYAIIAEGARPTLHAYVVPNESQRRGYDEIAKYAVSVDAIEAKTGLDFFADLDDRLEDVLEADVAHEPM